MSCFINPGESYCYLGRRCYNGIGRTPKNYYAAREMMQLSAEKNYSVGQYYYAEMWYNGIGGEQNYEKAFFWYKIAANKGCVEAQRILAKLYENGIGCEINLKKAEYWKELTDKKN